MLKVPNTEKMRFISIIRFEPIIFTSEEKSGIKLQAQECYNRELTQARWGLRQDGAITSGITLTSTPEIFVSLDLTDRRTITSLNLFPSYTREDIADKALNWMKFKVFVEIDRSSLLRWWMPNYDITEGEDIIVFDKPELHFKSVRKAWEDMQRSLIMFLKEESYKQT